MYFLIALLLMVLESYSWKSMNIALLHASDPVPSAMVPVIWSGSMYGNNTNINLTLVDPCTEFPSLKSYVKLKLLASEMLKKYSLTQNVEIVSEINENMVFDMSLNIDTLMREEFGRII